jgi:uncharacterized protein YlxW (UPF0749 family)
MVEAWERVAPVQRTSELIDLIEEQKGRDIKHQDQENAQEKKSSDRDVQLAELIETLSKHVMELERRVTELEKKNNS